MINRATFVPEQFGQLTAIGWEALGQFSARKVSLMVEKDTFGVCNDRDTSATLGSAGNLCFLYLFIDEVDDTTTTTTTTTTTGEEASSKLVSLNSLGGDADDEALVEEGAVAEDTIAKKRKKKKKKKSGVMEDQENGIGKDCVCSVLWHHGHF